MGVCELGCPTQDPGVYFGTGSSGCSNLAKVVFRQKPRVEKMNRSLEMRNGWIRLRTLRELCELCPVDTTRTKQHPRT